MILMSIWSNYLQRTVKAGEVVDTMVSEVDRWKQSGYAKYPDPPELDPEKCAHLVGDDDHQCSKKPGHGPGSVYCKIHGKQYATDDVDIQEQV